MFRTKTLLQQCLKSAGLYDRLKASRLYDAYWHVVDRGVLRQRDAEVTFYRSVLNGLQPGSLIFDVGANQGTKTAVFLRLGAKVVAIEPDAANQETLRRRFLRYRLRKCPVILVPLAVSEKEGVDTFWIDAPGSAKNTLSEKWVNALRNDRARFGERLTFGSQRPVVTTTLDELINRHGVPFLIKIDVEGAEVKVLRGLSRPVRYLSFEVNLPEFREEGLECVHRLHHIAPNSRFNYTMDVSRGLALREWFPATRFLGVLESCQDSSVEVLWKVE
jgi:FkbM family methyltransferase